MNGPLGHHERRLDGVSTERRPTRGRAAESRVSDGSSSRTRSELAQVSNEVTTAPIPQRTKDLNRRLSKDAKAADGPPRRRSVASGGRDHRPGPQGGAPALWPGGRPAEDSPGEGPGRGGGAAGGTAVQPRDTACPRPGLCPRDEDPCPRGTPCSSMRGARHVAAHRQTWVPSPK